MADDHSPTDADTTKPFTPEQRRGWGFSLALTLLRLMLAPVCALLAGDAASSRTISILLVVGFASDVLDGVVARRANASTPLLRRLDSSVDTVFYLGIAWAAWQLFPAIIVAHLTWIATLLIAEGLNYVVGYARLGAAPAYHATSARVFGATLFGALVLLFATRSDVLLLPALALGVLATTESIAISLILPEPRHDVAGVGVALRLRREVARDRS